MVADAVAIAVVALAASWLLWRGWRKLRGRGGCGCGCGEGGCPAQRAKR
jgi:hypothetical protein